jgi:hypothetical protein
MSDKINPSRSLDVLGIRPVAKAVDRVSEAAVVGASAFLSRICLPAAEELGLLIRDTVAAYRARNAATIALKAKAMLDASAQEQAVCAHPRIVGGILVNGSWNDADDVQDMWAGLLASSCTPDGTDETNLIFVDLLARLTASEVRILNHSCTAAKKVISEPGWVVAEYLAAEAADLLAIAGHSEVHRLDLELDHLRSLELINVGFGPLSTIADVTPTALALNLYARCQGFLGSPMVFFKLSKKPDTTSA